MRSRRGSPDREDAEPSRLLEVGVQPAGSRAGMALPAVPSRCVSSARAGRSAADVNANASPSGLQRRERSTSRDQVRPTRRARDPSASRVHRPPHARRHHEIHRLGLRAGVFEPRPRPTSPALPAPLGPSRLRDAATERHGENTRPRLSGGDVLEQQKGGPSARTSALGSGYGMPGSPRRATVGQRPVDEVVSPRRRPRRRVRLAGRMRSAASAIAVSRPPRPDEREARARASGWIRMCPTRRSWRSPKRIRARVRPFRVSRALEVVRRRP